MFKKVLFSIAFLSLFAFPALAEEDLPDPGILPDHPFYFVKTFFEDVGTFLTTDDTAKAERYTELAQKRIAEAKAMAEKDKPEEAEKALERYKYQIEKAVEKTEKVKEKNEENQKEKINQITEKIARSTAKHFDVLDKVFDQKLPESKEAIREAKEASSDGQIRALGFLVKEKPEEAVEIFEDAIEKRLDKIEKKVDYKDDKDTEEAVEEYNKYANFGHEISALAQGLKANDLTVEELVHKTTSHHLEVLKDVREKIDEKGKEKIEKAIQIRERIENKQSETENQVGQETKEGTETKTDKEEGEDDEKSTEQETENTEIETESESTEEACVQVVSYAKNKETGECKQFSTSCDIPEGWSEENACADEDEGKDEDEGNEIIEEAKELY